MGGTEIPTTWRENTPNPECGRDFTADDAWPIRARHVAPRARSAEPRPGQRRDATPRLLERRKFPNADGPGAREDESSRSCPSAAGGAGVGCRCGRRRVSQSRPRSSRATQRPRSCAVASGDRELTFTREPAPEVHSSPQPAKPPRGPSVGAAPTPMPPTAACRGAARSALSIRATSRMSLHAPWQVTEARPERQRFAKFH